MLAIDSHRAAGSPSKWLSLILELIQLSVCASPEYFLNCFASEISLPSGSRQPVNVEGNLLWIHFCISELPRRILKEKLWPSGWKLSGWWASADMPMEQVNFSRFRTTAFWSKAHLSGLATATSRPHEAVMHSEWTWVSRLSTYHKQEWQYGRCWNQVCRPVVEDIAFPQPPWLDYVLLTPMNQV